MATDRLSQSRGQQRRKRSVNFVFNVFGQPGVSLTGTPGKDVIFGTGENDTLTGDAGNDTFVFSFLEQNFGTDTITDFKVGGASGEMDKIMLINGPYESFEELELADAIDYIEATGAAVIDVGVGAITLENVTGLTPDHFVFQHVPQN